MKETHRNTWKKRVTKKEKLRRKVVRGLQRARKALGEETLQGARKACDELKSLSQAVGKYAAELDNEFVKNLRRERRAKAAQ